MKIERNFRKLSAPRFGAYSARIGKIFLLLLISLNIYCGKQDTRNLPNNFLLMNATRSDSIVLQAIKPPEYVNRFWIEGGAWLGDPLPAEAELFYVIGKDSADLWFVGYSFKQKAIQIFHPQNQQNFPPVISDNQVPISSKGIRIIPPNNKIYFKLIIYSDQKAKVEVNGVPLQFDFPLNLSDIRILGYYARQATVKWEKMKQRGD